LLRVLSIPDGRHLRGKATGTRPKIIVSADGRGVVGHAGARLLADVAEVTGLTDACSDALSGLRQRRGVHDPGRIAVDLAVMLADGGEAISDLSVLRDQAILFGQVASDPTAWRLLSDVDDVMLGRLREARAQARELAWAQAMETRGGLPQATAAGRVPVRATSGRDVPSEWVRNDPPDVAVSQLPSRRRPFGAGAPSICPPQREHCTRVNSGGPPS
jgi:DDE family transposase